MADGKGGWPIKPAAMRLCVAALTSFSAPEGESERPGEMTPVTGLAAKGKSVTPKVQRGDAFDIGRCSLLSLLADENLHVDLEQVEQR